MSVIEVGSGRQGISHQQMMNADFVLDLSTFTVYKHRYGERRMNAEEAAKWLTYYMDRSGSRILLLTD